MFDLLISTIGSQPAIIAAVGKALCTINGQQVECPDFESVMAVAWGIMLSALVVTILFVVSTWKVFQKAGQPGWAALVPIYNVVIMFRMVGLSAWYVLLALVPIANVVVYIIVMYRISLAFGKGIGFAVGLYLLGFIFFPILAFGNSRYSPEETWFDYVPPSPAPTDPANPPPRLV